MEFPSAIVALGGGTLIGLAATLFLLLNGRIAGISSILAELRPTRPGDSPWRWGFVLGLVAGGATLSLTYPQAFEPASDALTRYGVAGFLVGLGARMGNGCTSGHGVCGLSRRSFRSLVATLTFIVTGMVTVYLTRHGSI